ncbi:ribonuclease J [Luteimicrobium subarcticum]|uniref:Ribonuclease J n=1 Tax=Luteimicrobium subarcticum TaxID=620910 RepID=A0A2M8WTX2_9MICO|nr:ribonuclease J [Luteimicrobium subarcticum]PJI94390.1 ribonuclease J [Luteimicrobium subarcticum]
MSHLHTELTTPPPLPSGALRIVALGGLGEVGRNMAVLEHEGKLLVIDCGVLFPEDSQPGVDLILPDFDYIADRLDDVEAIVLTHGHEDHIGAVPYLLRLRRDIPLVGSQLTLAFVEAKLKEHRINPVTLTVKEGQVEKLGVFECEFVAVNHSIPDALAVAVTTAAGTVLHTGDFKMDQLPLDGRITDLRAFARLGERGVDLFMVDSTNAEVPGFVTPEREIGPVLDQVFGQSDQRIIVASFSSHVHRVQQVLDAAYAHGRRVALVGRSMVRNMGIAADLGYLKVPDGVLIDLRKVDSLRDDEIVLMCTGSQGEPMAALSRIANHDHKVTVGPGDTVILASSLIPGNENAVFRVINGLTRLGARVVHSGNAKVHVSGHSGAGELLYCYNIVKPKNVMPVHGEVRHLVANGALAVKTGVPPERVVLAEDGVVIDLVDGKASVVGAVPCRYVYVDGSSVGEITEAELKDRLTLGEEGFVSVFAVVDSATGKVIAGPQILARGLAEDDKVFADVQPQVARALEDAIAGGATDTYQLQQIMRRVVGRFVATKLRRRPMIVPVVVEA